MFIDEIQNLAKKIETADQPIAIRFLLELLNSRRPEGRAYSDKVSRQFVETFGDQLRLHHLRTPKLCHEDTFQLYLFASCQLIGIPVTEPDHRNNEGEDITIADEKFSLKSETNAKFYIQSSKKRLSNLNQMNISKMIEGGWLKDGILDLDHIKIKNQEAINRIMKHLQHYERIWALRSFRYENLIRYDLIEIPKKMIEAVAEVKPDDFWALENRKDKVHCTQKLTRHADVPYGGISDAWQIYLDGSDGKVSLKKIKVGLCERLASWAI